MGGRKYSWKNTNSGATKQLLINETLAALIVARDKLEEVTGASRSRLPGDSGVLGSLVSGGLGLKI